MRQPRTSATYTYMYVHYAMPDKFSSRCSIGKAQPQREKWWAGWNRIESGITVKIGKTHLIGLIRLSEGLLNIRRRCLTEDSNPSFVEMRRAATSAPRSRGTALIGRKMTLSGKHHYMAHNCVAGPCYVVSMRHEISFIRGAEIGIFVSGNDHNWNTRVVASKVNGALTCKKLLSTVAASSTRIPPAPYFSTSQLLVSTTAARVSKQFSMQSCYKSTLKQPNFRHQSNMTAAALLASAENRAFPRSCLKLATTTRQSAFQWDSTVNFIVSCELYCCTWASAEGDKRGQLSPPE